MTEDTNATTNSAATTVLPFYRGMSNFYTDIATRAGAILGLGLVYAAHPSNVGVFIIRFVAHGIVGKPADYTHFAYREPAAFIAPSAEGRPFAENFKGVRLNKFAVPAFSVAVRPHEIAKFGDSFNTFQSLAEWIIAQAVAEGFTPTLDLPALTAWIRGQFALPDSVNVESTLQFPDLTAPENKPKAVVVEAESDEGDENDPDDDDEKDEDEGWLN